MLTLNSVGGQETKLKKIPENMLDQLSQYYNSKQLDLYAKRHFYSYWNLYAKIHPEVFAWVFFLSCSPEPTNFLSNSWFYYLVLYKPQQRNLEFWTYFSVISFLCSAAKEGCQTQIFKPNFSNPAFQNSGSNPTWFWKPPKKSISNLKKAISGLL